MTVSIQSNNRHTLLGGVKQLQRRCLPTQARLANNRKQSLATQATSSNKEEIIVTPSRRLNSLRRSYSRRGVPSKVTPPRRVSISEEEARKASDKNHGVSQVSLAGAKRSYAQLDVPSDVEYESDSSNSCLSLASSSMMSSCNYNRYVKASRRRIRTVQFATLCAVVEIPHFCEYTSKQKMAMWNGSKKIRTMAKRNSAEFQFDGWSIETAAEEDDFVIVDGKSVHPVYAAAESSETPIS